MSRTSVEPYRETSKTISEICEELGVSYLLEGSFQQYGNQARLTVQLIHSGTEGHAWASDYDREWSDILAVTSEVAQTIAGELQVIITPEEKQLIEKIPTTSFIAHDYYMRGREEWLKQTFNSNNREASERAVIFYNQALAYDSTFARAYTELGYIYCRTFQR